jgi:hypothetical protein
MPACLLVASPPSMLDGLPQERPRLVTTIQEDYQTPGSGNIAVTRTKCGPDDSVFQVLA